MEIAHAGKDFTLLGPLHFVPEGGGDKKMFPAGTQLRVLDIRGDRVLVKIGKTTYSADREAAEFYFESGNDRERFLLGDALKTFGSLEEILDKNCCFVGGAADSCYWRDPQGEWNAEASMAAPMVCPLEKVDVVKRIYDEPYSTDCRNPGKYIQLVKDGWKSCAPPPVCQGSMDEIKRQQANWRKQEKQAECSKQPKPKFSHQPEESCLLKFEKPIRKIVVHQTDGYSHQGPNHVFNVHRDRGYDDLGYHYVIAKDEGGKWRVFEGRPRKYEGAHGGPGSNSDSLAIAIAGCFRTAPISPTKPCKESDRPPPEAVRLLTNLFGKLKKEVKDESGKPTIQEITGHGEHRFAETTCHSDCPSPACQLLVNSLKARFFPGGKP